jgi:hypothetical protein
MHSIRGQPNAVARKEGCPSLHGCFLIKPFIYKYDEHAMPQKIRELIRELEKTGFINRGGKGSHRNFSHKSGVRIRGNRFFGRTNDYLETISGHLGDDAKPYQEREVKNRPFPHSSSCPPLRDNHDIPPSTISLSSLMSSEQIAPSILSSSSAWPQSVKENSVSK